MPKSAVVRTIPGTPLIAHDSYSSQGGIPVTETRPFRGAIATRCTLRPRPSRLNPQPPIPGTIREGSRITPQANLLRRMAQPFRTIRLEWRQSPSKLIPGAHSWCSSTQGPIGLSAIPLSSAQFGSPDAIRLTPFDLRHSAYFI